MFIHHYTSIKVVYTVYSTFTLPVFASLTLLLSMNGTMRFSITRHPTPRPDWAPRRGAISAMRALVLGSSGSLNKKTLRDGIAWRVSSYHVFTPFDGF